MRENSRLDRIAFWAVTALSVAWAAFCVGALTLGLVATPWGFVPLLIAFGPMVLVAAAVVADRLRSAEDRHYSENVHD